MRRSVSIILLMAVCVAGCAPVATPTAAPTPPATTEAPTSAPTEVPTQAATEAPTAGPQAQILNVFAAASLTNAFNEIGKNFEAANPGVTVTFNFAGSQALQTQIEQGAPADVFASASKTYMDMLVTDNYVTADVPQNFLTNKLVVILPANNPAGLAKLEDLARPNTKLVLAAEAVPVGKYALQALDLMDAKFGTGYKTRVLANVVSQEDNVKQVVSKV